MENSSLFIILQRMRIPFLVIVISYTIAIIGLLVIDGVDLDGQPYQMTIFDAFYFVTYTATTIGFGETPYEFTYSQRIWVTFSIYLTVLGWFYGIGSLVSLLQDKLFLEEIHKAKFLRQVKGLKEKFIIILGYNQVTSEIIKKAIKEDIRTVVIENDKNKINQLLLESFTPSVPVLYSSSYSIKALELAGIKKNNCKALVTLFQDDSINLKISLTSKLLNNHIKIVAKATTSNQTDNLKDLEVEIIANPFSIISSEIKMALMAPNLFRLEKWMYGIDNLVAKLPIFPKGKYIICGYGRLGAKIHEKLISSNIDIELVELDNSKQIQIPRNSNTNITFGNADDKQMLLNIGIKDAVAIIAATNNDTINLSILATAKKLNPNITTIVRENEMEDFSIFKNANINHIFMPEKILINKTTNALFNPLSDKFIRLMMKMDDLWASVLIKKLLQEIDENPIICDLTIDSKITPEVFNYLKNNNSLKIEVLFRSLHNREKSNNVVPLLLQRGQEFILLPNSNEELKIDDNLLYACDSHAKDDIEYICQNMYEFHYALTGEEKRTIFKRN